MDQVPAIIDTDPVFELYVLGAILEPPSGEAKQGGVQTISDEG